jgi:hypothetical protein
MRTISPPIRSTVAIAALLMLGLLPGCSSTGESRQARIATRIRNRSALLLNSVPRKALLYTLIAQHVDRTDVGYEQLLDGDLAFRGIERILESPDTTITAIRTKQLVVSASRSSRHTGRLTTWDVENGQPLASIPLASPILRFAGFTTTQAVASIDERGTVSLWDLENPRSPTQFPILKLPLPGAKILTLGFTDEASVLDVIARSGTLYELDVASRRLLSVRSLQTTPGVRWPRPSPGALTAATVLSEPYSTTASLLLAARRQGIVRVNLATFRSSPVVPSYEIPGTPTEIAEVNLKEPVILIGTSDGVLQWPHKSSTTMEFNGPNAGLLLHENVVTLGNGTGITAARAATTDYALLPSAYHGPPVRSLEAGPGGPLAIGMDGSIELLENEHTGLNLPISTEERSTVANFGPEGNLLETAGPNANDIEDLIAVAPNTAQTEPGVITPNRVVRTYRPSAQWWTPGQTNPHGWFVDAAQLGEHYVVAGGQDPNGTAVVLVWNARSGRPLKRLPLTESGVNPENANQTSEPSIVSQVALLPRKHLLAAYSSLQELVAIWSTDTWQRVATIAAGPLDDFSVSPDESHLLLLSPSDTQSGLHADNATTQILFASLPSGRIEQHIRDAGAELAGFAPNGTITQITKGGMINQLSADGRHHIGSTITLEADTPRSIAWAPQGHLVAVGLSRGVSLVDLTTHSISDPLPPPVEAEPVAVSFSPDGQLLAASNATPVEDRYDAQAMPSIWTIGEHQLTIRACQVARMENRAEWRSLTQIEPYPEVCKASTAALLPAGPPVGGALTDHRLEVVYTHGESIGAAASDGTTLTLGSIEKYAMPQFAWSSKGDLAWIEDGVLHVIPPRSAIHSMPCSCSGVAFNGSDVVTIDADAHALTEFRAGLTDPVRVRLTGPRIQSPTLVALTGGRAIVGGYKGPPSGDTPSSLFLVTMSGKVRRLAANVRGSVYRTGVVSPSGRDVAIPVSVSGMCAPEHIDVLNVINGRLTALTMPSRVQDPAIRSLVWTAAGRLEAVLAPQECASPSKYEPEATTYTVKHERLVAPNYAGYDTQRGAMVTATIAGPVKRGEPVGSLTITLPRAKTKIIRNVESFLVRP